MVGKELMPPTAKQVLEMGSNIHVRLPAVGGLYYNVHGLFSDTQAIAITLV